MKPPETKASAAIALILVLIVLIATARGQDRFSPGGFFGVSGGKLLGLVPLPALFTGPEGCAIVMHRGTCVDLRTFKCKPTVSSFVNEVCYDEKNKYMLILLKATWYHYCNIPAETVNALESAKSVGKFYNSDVKGQFGCQGQTVPSY
jgi:KTSC domain